MIELFGVKKYYNKKLALDIPYMKLDGRTRYAIIGQNGSGKTTLLRLLAGVIQPDEGRIVSDIPRSETGYLPQKPYAFDMPAWRNVALGMSGGDRKSRAEKLLCQFGIGEVCTVRGKNLSGGEIQRMALARLLAEEKRAVFLDEPTSAADIQASEVIERLLKERAEQWGCLLVFTTHSPAQAVRLADEVVMLSAGVICEQGAAQSVMYSPGSAAMQSFLAHWRI